MTRLLIANRGEIACRIAATARMRGLTTIAVYSDADANARHVRMCDEAYRIGPASVAESYLRADVIITLAQRVRADAIHPGYGFLSENADFAEACADAGITFIGPPAAAIRAMGLKDQAKALMEQAGVPVVPGYHGERQESDFLAEQASDIGYPVLIKARAGGGGKGMRVVENAGDFTDALEAAQSEAQASFGDAAVLIEKLIATPRHIEIQIFADQHGHTVHLGERDCSLQRRHQKVLEEAPAPGMTGTLREAMGAAAVRAAEAVGYVGTGTVEFIADASDGLSVDKFYFMEMNTRLQVEHPVTEMVTGFDLVDWQLRVADGEMLSSVLPGSALLEDPRSSRRKAKAQEEIRLEGHAVEVRLYAEDAAAGFLPATGRLTHLRFPDGVRIDTGVEAGDAITPHYDPMIAKLIAHGPDRKTAFRRLRHALAQLEIAGCMTNNGFLARLMDDSDVQAGKVDTGLIARKHDDLVRRTEDEALWWLAAIALSDGLDFSVQILRGFALWQAEPYRLTMICEETDESKDIALQWFGPADFSIQIGEEKPLCGAVAALGDDRYRLTCDDRQLTAAVQMLDGVVRIMAQGETWTFSRPDPRSGEGSQTKTGDVVTSPMPGRIVSISVRDGDDVTAGQAVMVMEAMKMQHTLTAPRDGTVENLHVQPGDQVEARTLLLQMVDEA